MGVRIYLLHSTESHPHKSAALPSVYKCVCVTRRQQVGRCKSQATLFLPSLTIPYLLPLDHHSNWPPENSSTPAIGPCGQKAGPLLGVRRSCPVSPHVHLRPHRSLAGLHLVTASHCLLNVVYQIRFKEER